MQLSRFPDFLVFFCVIFLSTITVLQATEKKIVLKGSVDFLGFHQIVADKESGDTDVKTGYSLASELHLKYKDNFHYGFGIEYQIPREQLIEGHPGKKFSFFAVYGLFEASLAPTLALQPAFVIHGGYNSFNGNGYYRGLSKLSGGFYAAAGFNIALHENVRIEMMYKWRRGSVKEESDLNVNYRYISFTLCVIL